MTFGDELMYPHVLEKCLDVELLGDICPKKIDDLLWAEVRKDEKSLPYRMFFMFRDDRNEYLWDCTYKRGFDGLKKFEDTVLRGMPFIRASGSTMIGTVDIYVRDRDIAGVDGDGRIELRDGQCLDVEYEIPTRRLFYILKREHERRSHEQPRP